jgi:DNA polymerase-3 subunit beta
VKFSINQSEFYQALSIVAKGAATHSTLPILSGVYIEAADDQITLQTTDLERSVKYVSPALIEEEGSIVVPAKLLTDISKSLPDAAVHFEATANDAVIMCESSTFSIKGMDAIDFPGFPTIAATDSVEIPFTEFSQMVKKVARICSNDETRAILTGVFIQSHEGNLRMVATDSYRLAIADKPLENSTADFEAVIPGTFLLEVASLPPSADTVHLAISENQVLVEYRNVEYINRRLEGNYPNYNLLLPDGYKTRVTFDCKQLNTSIRRVALINGSSSPIKFDINQATGTTQLSAVTQDVGSSQEVLSTPVEGEDIQTAFNSTFILDGLSAIGTEEVSLELQDAGRPGIFKSGEGERFLYLVMPVRLF